jgi:tetratricopeptide (TPR) repeat protein
MWRRPAAGFAGVWFFLILAPTSSLMAINDAAFEQRMYLPLAAVAALGAAGAYRLARFAAGLLSSGRSGAASAMPAVNCALGVAAGAVLLVLAAATYQRNLVYADPEALWRDVLDKRPLNARAMSNLGRLLSDQGRRREAIDLLRASLAIKEYSDTYNTLGATLADEGKYGEAIPLYRKAIELRGEIAFPGAHANLGNAYMELAKAAADTHERISNLGQAVVEYGIAVEQLPDDWVVRRSLANALLLCGQNLAEVGRQEDAQASFQAALVRYEEAIRDGGRQSADIHNNMAVILSRQGRLDDAISHLRKALAIDPNDANARANLSRLLAQRGGPP